MTTVLPDFGSMSVMALIPTRLITVSQNGVTTDIQELTIADSKEPAFLMPENIL